MVKLIEDDLFNYEDDYYLAHCISADFALGKGIAKEFDIRYQMREKLINKYPNYYSDKKDIYQFPENADCILLDKVFNLVTKSRYFYKPTYMSLYVALCKMKSIMIEQNITKIAMPMIGCGLDKLCSNNVMNMINTLFEKEENMEVIICIKPSGIIH